MFSLSRAIPRASRSSVCASCLRQLSTSSAILKSPSQALKTPSGFHPIFSSRPTSSFSLNQQRAYVSKTSADALIEEIQDQYGTARDEFEIASEETEKKSVYAEDDRAAAREELDTLKEMFENALQGEDGEEVQRRVGQRIRELDQAVQALEKSAVED